MDDEEEKVNTTSYRDMLQKLEQESQKSYDKTVLTLSGGALGVSFAFVKDIIGDSPVVCNIALTLAWVIWGFSVACVLFSFFFSQRALKKAVYQLDAGNIPGNYFDKVTSFLNVAGGVLFLLGLISMVVFVAKNVR